MADSQLVTLKNEVNSKAAALQVLLNNPASSRKDIADAEVALANAVEKVQGQIASDAADICNKSEKPMLEALKTGFIDKFGITRKVDKASKFVSLTPETDTRKVYFPLDKVIGGTGDSFKKYLPTFSKMIAAAVDRSSKSDSDSKVEALRRSNKRKPDAVGATPESLFSLAQIDLDKDILSTNSLLKALSLMVGFLLGEDAPNMCKADVRIILAIGTKDGKEEAYRVSKDSTIQTLIQKAVYTRLNKLEYKKEA